MALARTENFSDKDIQFAEWCKALAHPARVVILRTLASKKDCICGDLVLDLPLAQSTVSQHLKALKAAGLIQGEVDGPRSRYCVHRKNFEKLVNYFEIFSEKLLEDIKENKC